MKRIIPFLLTVVLLLGGCGNEGSEETTQQPTQTQEPTYSNEGPEGILDENAPHTVYKLVRMVSLNENGIEQWHREYFYDADGFCTEEVEISNTGAVSYRHVNTPDASGNIASTLLTDSVGLSYTIQYEYDDQGRVVLQETYTDGVLTDKTEYTYDEQGNYLSIKQYFGGELAMDYSFSYTYNENGDQLTRDEYLFSELMNHVEMTYDDQGREISSVISMADGTTASRTESSWEGLTETRKYFGMDEQTPYLVCVITYDDHGNVILEENQYEGGAVTMTEYTYEPFEVNK